MSDRVLIPLPDGRWLALSDAAFHEALDAGAVAAGVKTQIEPSTRAQQADLVDANEVARVLSLKPSWVLRMAREHKIPCETFGKYKRFNVEAVRAATEKMDD